MVRAGRQQPGTHIIPRAAKGLLDSGLLVSLQAPVNPIRHRRAKNRRPQSAAAPSGRESEVSERKFCPQQRQERRKKRINASVTPAKYQNQAKMSSADKNSEVEVENVAAAEEKAETKEVKGVKRPADEKTAETKKVKKDENGAGEEEEEVEDEGEELEGEDEEYDLPYGDEEDIEAEDEEEEEGDDAECEEEEEDA